MSATPGPWTWDEAGGLYVTGSNRLDPVICDIVPRGTDYTDEDEANARLIAEAPALLTALRDIRDTLEAEPLTPGVIRALELAGEAIAKAEAP